MDENVDEINDCENLRKIKKIKTMQTDIRKINSNSSLNELNEYSFSHSKKYNSSKKLIDLRSKNSFNQIFKNNINTDNNKNKFISVSKIKIDDFKLRIANNKIKNYINNLIGGGLSNHNPIVPETKGSNNRSNMKGKKICGYKTNDEKGIIKNNQRNILSGVELNSKFGLNKLMNNSLKNDSNKNLILYPFIRNNNNNLNKENLDGIEDILSNNYLLKNGNIRKSDKINKFIESFYFNNELNDNTQDLSNLKKKSSTSKKNEESDLDKISQIFKNDSINKLKRKRTLVKYYKTQSDLNYNNLSELNMGNLLVLNDNNLIRKEEPRKLNFEFLDRENSNQEMPSSTERNFIFSENNNIFKPNNERKNYFLGLKNNNSIKDTKNNTNINLKKTETEINSNSSINSTTKKNCKLLVYDLAIKKQFFPSNLLDSNSNFLFNKSVNKSMISMNKNKDTSFESENLDREILDLHLRYSKNNFEDVPIKKKRKGKMHSFSLKKDEMNSQKKKFSKLNLFKNINNTFNNNNVNNLNQKNEISNLVNVENNFNTIDTHESQNNLILSNDNFRINQNSNSSERNLINQKILTTGNNKNINLQILTSNLNNNSNILFNKQIDMERNIVVSPTKNIYLTRSTQVNIPSNLIDLKNPNNVNTTNIGKNLVRNLQKNNYLKIHEEESERKDSYKENASSEDDRSIKIFHNIYDSFSGEDWDESKAIKPSYILRPNGKFKLVIDIISPLFVFYTIIFSPYIMAFEKDDEEQNKYLVIFDILIDFFFMLDFSLNFITAFRDEKDDLIFSLKKIVINYLKTWFIFDLISCIPFTFINYIMILHENELYIKENTENKNNFITSRSNVDIGSGVTKLQRFAKIAKFYRLLKWSKIVRLLKITKTNDNTKIFGDIHGLKSSINRFLKFLIIFVFLIHFATCIWIFVANLSISNGDPINWINSLEIIDESQIYIYITSLYFILVSFFSIGYGDITPKNFNERVISLFLLTVGCLVFSYALSSLSNIFSQIDKKREIYNKRESILKEIKIEYKLSQVLENRIKNSLKHDLNSWNEDRLNLLDSLPPILKNQLYLKMYENKIQNLIFFHSQSYEFITFAISYLKSVKFSRNDYIISIGEIIYEMYLNIKGVIGIELGSKYKKQEICQIHKNFQFGDILMYSNQQSKLSYKVKTYSSELFILSKINFAQIKLAFDKPTSKLLEQSYEFFMKIERTRILATRYYERYRNFDDFRSYLKKYINKKNMKYKKEKNNLSVDLHIQPNLENIRDNEELSNSDIFTIDSKKSDISALIKNTLEDIQERSFDSENTMVFEKNKISKISNTVAKFKESLKSIAHKKNISSNNIQIVNDESSDTFKTLKEYQYNKDSKDLNINNINENNYESMSLTKTNTNIKSNFYPKDNFNIKRSNMIKNKFDKDKIKLVSNIINKKSQFFNTNEPLEKINEDDSINIKKSKTSALPYKEYGDNINKKFRKMKSKNSIKDKNILISKNYIREYEVSNKKNTNIDLNYKGLDINSMLFNTEEKKKLKLRYRKLNLYFSSNSSFFDSEKDKKSKSINEENPLKKSKTSKYDLTLKDKKIKKNEKPKEISSYSKNIKTFNYSLVSNETINKKSDITNETKKSDKEINIKNQLIRCLTATTKKYYNEDINNFYSNNYGLNTDYFKLKNFDKRKLEKKTTINDKMKENKNFNKFRNKNLSDLSKEANSMKISDEILSKLSDYFDNNPYSIGETNKKLNKEIKNINNNDAINNKNIISEMSILNSTNSKNIIYINNLNINYSNQKTDNNNNNLLSNDNFSNSTRNIIRATNNINDYLNINSNDIQISNKHQINFENNLNLNSLNMIMNPNNTYKAKNDHDNMETSEINQNEAIMRDKQNLNISTVNNFQKENNELIENEDSSNCIKLININDISDKAYFTENEEDKIFYKNNENNKSKDSNIKNISDNNFFSDNNDCKYSDNSNSMKIKKQNKVPITQKISLNQNLYCSNHNVHTSPNRKKSSNLHKKRGTNIPKQEDSKSQKKINDENNTALTENQTLSNNLHKIVPFKFLRYLTKQKENNDNVGANSFNKFNSKKTSIIPKKSVTNKFMNKNISNKLSNNKNIINDFNKRNFSSNKLINSSENNSNLDNIYDNFIQNLKPGNLIKNYPNMILDNNTKPTNSVLNKNNVSEANVISKMKKHQTQRFRKSEFDNKVILPGRKSGFEIRHKTSINPNVSNNFPNRQSLGNNVRFLRKKSFLELPNNFLNADGTKNQDFLETLSNKITYDAYLYKNKEVLQNCIKDFLYDIKDESRFKHLMNRLNNLELMMKEYVKNTNKIFTNRRRTSKKNLEKIEKIKKNKYQSD